MDWYQGNNDKEKETPAGGIKRVGYVLWNYVGRLVVVNMLFLLCCIPIVTIPAALAALNRYLLGIYQSGIWLFLGMLLEGFKSGILKNHSCRTAHRRSWVLRILSDEPCR